MIVTLENFDSVIDRFKKSDRYGFDTETTGLRVYHEDSLFSLILADYRGACYFNFQEYTSEFYYPLENGGRIYWDDGYRAEYLLPRAYVFKRLNEEVFSNKDSMWFAHNIKFDLAMLKKEGVAVGGSTHDTLIARLIDNRHYTYALGDVLSRKGRAKNDKVEEFINKHKLITQALIPGKKTKVKLKHFDKVPFSIISDYGLDDGIEVRFLGESQLTEVSELQKTIGAERKSELGDLYSLKELVETEKKLSNVCFSMEQVGIKIDREYCVESDKEQSRKITESEIEFKRLSGIAFRDSATVYKQVFSDKLHLLRETKTRVSFDDTELGKLDSPLVEHIRAWRKATKLSSTYFKNYTYYADKNNIIHPNINQFGTATGRFSYSNPNLQNVPKDEDIDPEVIAVRRCFVPREDYCFTMIDYDQMEYRLMLEYASELKVIDQILNQGLDVHQATAKTMGTDRTRAKTLNFMLLYGGGNQKLADALGIPIEQAKEARRIYFSSLPSVSRFVRSVIRRAEVRGYIHNWRGRPYYFEPAFAYKGPNYLIQGGCSEVVKLAMVRCHELFEKKRARSRIVLQVHDELVFEIHWNELELAGECKNIMEQVYPHKRLPLTCGIDHSYKSWADKVQGAPV